MFEDTKDGQTHYVGDSCNPPLTEKTFNLINYKGKYDIIQDKDILYNFDVAVGEITREDAIKQAKERIKAGRYYGIPAIITKDKELNEIYDNEDIYDN